MRFLLVATFLSFYLMALDAVATDRIRQDTIIPSKHKFISNEVHVPKAFEAAKLVKQFMEYLKAGKRTIGFLHEDELDMIEEKKLTEKRLFFDSYQVVSIGKRMAMVKVFSARGTSITCKMLMLRYYQNMHGHYLLVPGKVEKFEKKMGDITIKKVFLNTWTTEQRCN
jgi:hypothetical protein